MARKGDLPDDLACFLQQQKQRQARLETTMRSFPTSAEVEIEKAELANKRKRVAHEVSNDIPQGYHPSNSSMWELLMCIFQFYIVFLPLICLTKCVCLIF